MRVAYIRLPLSQLEVGLTVKLPLSWREHPFMLNKIKIKDDAQIALIRGLDIPYVYLVEGEPTADVAIQVPQSEPEPPEAEAVRDPVAETRKAIHASQKQFFQGVSDTRSLYSKLNSDPEGAYRLSATLVEDLMTHLHGSDTPQLALVKVAPNEVNITQHGVSVAVIAMMMGHSLGLAPRELRDIALGCLFHDIGKFKVPDAIRRKRGALNEHETKFMRMHPNFGHEMLERSGLFPAEMLHIVLHHHEYLDGSGYPHRLKGKQIPLLTQIVSLANDYEHQFGNEQVDSPQLALGYLFKHHGAKHSPELLSTLVKVLGIYPPGTLVSLTDGSIAKVVMTTGEAKQPHVLACQPGSGQLALRFLIEEEVHIAQILKREAVSDTLAGRLQLDMGISYYFCAPPA
ncbi:HD-GYP domain-containing protein [Shewanella sp. AS16]|uniref:HD-GYP domain-containing protein n=1 Tax=Shewanella sp. AS16 TaxID=2907625 RepID=UPI003FA3784E